MLTVLDLGSGTLPGIARALEHLGAEVEVAEEVDFDDRPDGIVLPWSGPVTEAMTSIEDRDLADDIRELVDDGTRILGVGAGAQLLAERLDDGTEGLGLIPGAVLRLDRASDGKPRSLVGWTPVIFSRPDPLFDGVSSGTWFYFLASHLLQPASPEDVLAKAEMSAADVPLGTPEPEPPGDFAAVVRHGHATAVVFEAARSGSLGLRLLANFARPR